MPDAVTEVFHLIRDSLVYEEEAIAVPPGLAATLDRTLQDETKENWIVMFAGRSTNHNPNIDCS